MLEGKNFITDLLRLVVEQNASDIHMLEGERPRLRIKGELHAVDSKKHPVVEREDIESLMKHVLSEQQLRQFEETNDIDFSLNLKGATCRVNVGLANRHKLHLVMRYLREAIIPMDELGIDVAMLKELAESNSGLILVTGETSSGKTTTIASMLDYINSTRSGAITTIENPVEYTIPSRKCLVTRREIGRDTPSFQSALRSSMRKNPDVLLIGEIRDLETGGIAMSAAETGILTFGTLHAVGAIPSLIRLTGIMVEPDQDDHDFYMRLSYALRGIIFQQLIKSLDGLRYMPVYEILNITDIERSYIRAKDYPHLEQSLESERSISLGECLYRMWREKPRPIDEGTIRRFMGSQTSVFMNMLNQDGGYRATSAWVS